MFDFEPMIERLRPTRLGPRLNEWISAIEGASQKPHGDVPKWHGALEALPERTPSSIELDSEVRIGTAEDLSIEQRALFEATLQTFHPWRKGPFHLFGTHIDTEWRSDWKWERLADNIAPLTGRMVLDIGSGNGYYGWRMLGRGAKTVVGVDPMWLYLYQLLTMRKYIDRWDNLVLPLRGDDVPAGLRLFDSVFSMGVLYHVRSPMDHLIQMREALRPGGELVLETIVIDGSVNECLVPEGRYAQMPNVWFIPSVLMLEKWLKKCGLKRVELIDVTPTTTAEQRSTPWMRFHSLEQYLDPADPARTVEGHPAPIRAIFKADAP